MSVTAIFIGFLLATLLCSCKRCATRLSGATRTSYSTAVMPKPRNHEDICICIYTYMVYTVGVQWWSNINCYSRNFKTTIASMFGQSTIFSHVPQWEWTIVHSRSVKQQLDRLQLQVWCPKSIPETLRDDFWNFKNKCADRCKPLASRRVVRDLCHASKGTQVMKPKPSDKSLQLRVDGHLTWLTF